MKNYERKKLFTYILGAYGVSGLFALPLILNPHLHCGTIYYILMFLAQFGPFISSFGTMFRFEGKDGIMELVNRGTSWRFSWYIYVLVFTIPAIFMFCGVLIGTTILKVSPITWIMFPNTLLTALVAPLGEEFGWRGFATPQLQKELSPMKTSLILGVIWAGWHYWIFLIPGQYKNDIPFAIFLMSCIADTLWFTWFYNKSKLSILVGILFHFSYNLTYHIVPINPIYFYGNVTPYLIMVICELIFGIIINCVFSKRINN